MFLVVLHDMTGWVGCRHGIVHEYLVISDNVCQEGEELDLNGHKVHISLLVEVGACSGGGGGGGGGGRGGSSNNHCLSIVLITHWAWLSRRVETSLYKENVFVHTRTYITMNPSALLPPSLYRSLLHANTPPTLLFIPPACKSTYVCSLTIST